MKILLVITSLRTGGAERVVATLAKELAGRDNEVDLLLFDGTETPLLKSLEESEVNIIAAGKGAFQMWNPLHVFKLRRVMKKGKYDIVHTHNSPAQILAAIAARNLSLTLVTTEHNTTTKRRKSPLLKWIDPVFYRPYRHIVCVSDLTLKNLIDSIGINPSKVTVIPNGIDLSRFTPDRITPVSEGLPPVNPGDKIILMTGAFRKQKDQPTLIRAMEYLPENYHLWLAGGWKLKRAAEKLSKKLGLEKRVTFLGERNDVADLMQKADINVLATHYEGMPLAAIEAMASGKPFVASDVPGVADIASGAAWLVPPRNPRALAEAIRRTLESEIISREISDNCRQRASKHDIKKVVDSHISLYKSLYK